MIICNFFSINTLHSVPLGWRTVDVLKLSTKRWCKSSRRVLICSILVNSLFFFFLYTKIQDIYIPFKRPIPSDEDFTNQGILPSSGVTTLTSSKAPETTTEPQTPVPYKARGPYWVEYPHEYHFTINEPNKCELQKPFLVLMVPVAPRNRLHRNIIRSTWGNERLVLGKVVTLFFVLGQHIGEEAEQIQKQLLEESEKHHDLIQGNFMDCYNNLTIKTMVMMEWLNLQCPNISYAMKIDSDMFLNVPKLISMLLNAPKTNYMTGSVIIGARVFRDRESKWFLPESSYPDPYFPPYANGVGYVFTQDLPKKLVEASRHVKALFLEDVYIGMCMLHLKLHFTNPPVPTYFHTGDLNYSRCGYSRLIYTQTSDLMDRIWIWKDFKKPGSYC
ncbi:beta-1,3-galactosyltransferase 1-like [Labrus mixtus]|uniref:beta-1,3-galactosyltransferase 1-like n=1 Tax=Labrus mixtus TaxID=508554 RepID=UPI0029BFBDAA|nr:beta-1,3-galactosyltransferase 1-like [Labrus mixtus]